MYTNVHRTRPYLDVNMRQSGWVLWTFCLRPLLIPTCQKNARPCNQKNFCSVKSTSQNLCFATKMFSLCDDSVVDTSASISPELSPGSAAIPSIHVEAKKGERTSIANDTPPAPPQEGLLVANNKTLQADNKKPTTPLLSHQVTICMVPPENRRDLWEILTRARTELRDPGLYRWPPHVNLLYPFINILDPKNRYDPIPAVDGKSETNLDNCMDDHQYSIDVAPQTKRTASGPGWPPVIEPAVLHGIMEACRRVAPFTCRLKRFGTFGGGKRGVLWLYPETQETPGSALADSPCESVGATPSLLPPLIRLQAFLEEQFPMCTDIRKVTGSFNPHMTLSHFINLDSALEAQQRVESWWPPGNQVEAENRDTDDAITQFEVRHIYLLARKDDAGQFLRVADFELGSQGMAIVHPVPRPFAHMPAMEEDWVRQERLQLKNRRNRNGRGRWRRGKES